MTTVDLSLSEKQREFVGEVLYGQESDTVVFGGARYNGKSFANCLAAPLCCLTYPGIRVLMLRQVADAAERNLGEELDNIHALLKLPKGAVQKLITRRQYRYTETGSYIQLGYCRLDEDWQVYKGLQYEYIFFEEGTQFREVMFDGLRGSARARRPLPGLKPKKVLTTNPDGRGFGWVKRRFVDEKTREEGVYYIGCKVRDSLPTLEIDPGYVLRELRKLPQWQQRQWELGDWDAMQDQYWSMRPDVFNPNVEIPEWADIYCGVDAGYWPSAFACVWFAKWTDFKTGTHRIHAFRDLKRHKLNLREQARAAIEIEETFWKPVKARWADPACWKRSETDEGLTTTTAHTWAQNGFTVSQAFSNTRVGGWMLKRTLMDDGVYTLDPNGCPNTYAEMVESVHGKNDDDMHKDCEDHCQDSERYALVSVFAGGYARKQSSKRTLKNRKAEVLRLVAGGYRGGR